jgi:hypothetical protein
MEVQVVTQISLERRAVQKRDEKVDAREIEVDEVVDQVWLWETVARWVEAQGSAFPLSTLYMSGAKGRAPLPVEKHLPCVGSRTRDGAWPCGLA